MLTTQENYTVYLLETNLKESCNWSYTDLVVASWAMKLPIFLAIKAVSYTQSSTVVEQRRPGDLRVAIILNKEVG